MSLHLAVKYMFRYAGAAALAAALCCVSLGEAFAAHVYPRLITPNGDGINDLVFFVLQNPTAAQTQGTIYNAQMLKVADVRESSISMVDRSILYWDGKDEAGATVNAGIYIYKVQIGNETFTGTVGVAR